MENVTSLAVTKIKNILPNILAPIGTMIIPFIPDGVFAHYNEGKMTMASLKNNEAIFDKLLVELNRRMEEECKKIVSQEDPFSALQNQEQINLAMRYKRYIRTLKKSLKYININDEPEIFYEANTTSPSWFDMFREIATRMNEDWREDLLARCVALEDVSPGAISLRTLWNIGLLETQMFHAFALFLDSSIDLDGYPIIALEQDDLTLNIESTEGEFHGVLIHIISGLIDWGLVQHGDFVLPSDEPIVMTAKDESAELINMRQKEGATTLMRFSGYHCTDLGLDLYRLYEPKYNHISQLSFQALMDILKETTDIKINIT
ncbi:DUF2806 domain-containing protein [Vibrio mimicus]